MPQDLPGFYFDADKNRYFPIKGPIPGSNRNSSSASTSSSSSTTARLSIFKPSTVRKSCTRLGTKTVKLLQVRELYGNIITSSKGKCNFQEEYLKILAPQPVVWKYHETYRIGDALEQMHVNLDGPHGLTGTDILLAGGEHGCLSFNVLRKAGQQIDYGRRCMPICVWPREKREGFVDEPPDLWKPSGNSELISPISCIKKYGERSNTDDSPMRHALITTLGSGISGGSCYILNLSEPFNLSERFNYESILRRRLYKVTSFDCTVWTADCNSDGSQAMVGTNLGAALVNLETGVPSWVFRCKSDVLSLKLDHSGQIALCGLRNGAIVTADARQKSEGLSARLPSHQIYYSSHGICKPSSGTTQDVTKPWFELKGNIYQSNITSMPSSICCLAALHLYDQYFLASSMDGSIRLYDQRLMQRGPIQFYEGNVNSHTRLQFGVDPYERMFLSGGVDRKLRLWSIKSGELLYEKKFQFMNFVPEVVFWPKELPRVQDERQKRGDYAHTQEHSWGAWVGSREGLFYMNWP